MLLPLHAPLARSPVAGQSRRVLRTAASAGLATLLIAPFALSDGGYFGRSYLALTVALAAVVGLAVAAESSSRPLGAAAVTVVALGLLAGWVALSATWAIDATGVGLELRRCVLYGVALLAVSVLVDLGRRRAFLLGLTGTIAAVTLVGLWQRAVSGGSVDPYYGTLLAEPVGYPNAMGVLAAMGATLAIGLSRATGERGARALRGLACLLVLGLGLTGSRGAALALVLGLVVLVALSPAPARWSHVTSAAASVAIGGGAWAVCAAQASAVTCLAAACGAAALGAIVPTLGRRGSCALVAAVAAAGTVALAAQPPPTGSSLRSAYWSAAAAELRERPVLGSGAGTFHLTWREHRTVDAEVRDAHSLYVETLSELGPVGLASSW